MTAEQQIIGRVKRQLPRLEIKPERRHGQTCLRAVNRAMRMSMILDISVPPVPSSSQLTMIADETVLLLKRELLIDQSSHSGLTPAATKKRDLSSEKHKGRYDHNRSQSKSQKNHT